MGQKTSPRKGNLPVSQDLLPYSPMTLGKCLNAKIM